MNKIYSDMKKQMTPSEDTVRKALSKPAQKPARKPLWYILAPAGVCAAALALALIAPSLENPAETVTDTTTTYPMTTTPAETHIVKRWDEMSDQERYTMLDFNGKMYDVSVFFSPARTVSNSDLYTLLGTATASGYDYYAETTRYLDVEVYAITGIETKCAVAVKFPGDDAPYAYTNYDYVPSTLGELISDLNLRENIRFNNIYYDYSDESAFYYFKYALSDDAAIWSMLLSDGSLITLNPELYRNGLMSISVDIDLIGIENLSLAVTEDGYLQTNILGMAKVYFIGMEKVNAFVNYVKQNGMVVGSSSYPINNQGTPETTFPGSVSSGYSGAQETVSTTVVYTTTYGTN